MGRDSFINGWNNHRLSYQFSNNLKVNLMQKTRGGTTNHTLTSHSPEFQLLCLGQAGISSGPDARTLTIGWQLKAIACSHATLLAASIFLMQLTVFFPKNNRTSSMEGPIIQSSSAQLVVPKYGRAPLRRNVEASLREYCRSTFNYIAQLFTARKQN